MVESIKMNLASAAKPAVVWLQTKGVNFAWDLVAAAVVLLIGAVAIRLLEKGLRKTIDRKVGGRGLLASFFLSIVTKCAWALLVIVVLGQLGVSVAPLIAGLGVTGFVLGFAFQESLGSLAAGVMLAFNQPFKVGDRVIVSGQEGTVLRLDMMAVVLATDDKRMVTIPNKQAWGGQIVNFTALASGNRA